MSSTIAFDRVQRILGHVDGISAPSTTPSLSTNSTASTTVFGPSELTLAFFQKLRTQGGGGGKSSSKSPTKGPAVAPTTNTHVPDAEVSVQESLKTKHRLPKKGGATGASFDVDSMAKQLNVFYLEERSRILKTIGSLPSFQDFHGIGKTLPEQRETTHQQVKDFVANTPTFNFADAYSDPLHFTSHLEMLYYHSCTVATKAGVHFGLFGATVMNLGNEKQRAYYAPLIHSLEIRGCFCLTELGHGSNARDIETTATYDARTNEFVLVTPTETAQKIYIGNLAQHANYAVVFAQLIVGTQHVGVHAFVVRIRDENMNVVKGLRILDCGAKGGLNGVDNGRLWCDEFRCPATALLNKFGDIVNGKYVSPISSPLRRFTATIGSLVGGRIIVGQGAIHATKVGLTIATRYAHSRRQFGPAPGEEVPIMHFLSHQLRLLPLIAKCYGIQFTMNRLKHQYQAMSSTTGPEREEMSKELHVLAAGLKPQATWFKTEALQTCRELCGGMGFLACNRITGLKTDSDIDVTWEGDNTVLLQQVSASLLKEFKDQFKGEQSKFRGLLKYLEHEAAFTWQQASSFANPLARSNRAASRREMKDLDFYLQAFQFREGRLLRALVNRLGSFPKTRDGKKITQFDAWNESSDIVLELARAHVDRQILEAFIGVIDSLDQPTAAEDDATLVHPLRLLCALFALTTIQKNMGFYLTFRFFSSATSKLMWTTINDLCAKLVPFSLQLVEAFDIPESLIAAPIASDWKKAFTYPNVPGYTTQQAKQE